MNIRPATSADIPAIVNVDPTWSAAELSSSLHTMGVTAWVAVDDHVIGHVLASSLAGVGEILLIAVDPRFRNRGIGADLLHTAHAHWRQLGVREAWLEVRSNNVQALRLYEANGWMRFGLRKRYYRDGTDAVRMHWRTE